MNVILANLYTSPSECRMREECQSIIGAWSVGLDGQRIPDEYGFLIGSRGFRYAILEARLSLLISQIRYRVFMHAQLPSYKLYGYRGADYSVF